jgi:hypothetical protein
MLGSIFDGSIIQHPMDVFDKDLVIIKCFNGIVIWKFDESYIDIGIALSDHYGLLFRLKR